MPAARFARLSTLRWVNLHIPLSELNIDISLGMGQCFNWKAMNTTSGGKVYVGHVPGINHTPVALKYADNSTYFALISEAIDTSIERSTSSSISTSTTDTRESDKTTLSHSLLPLSLTAPVGFSDATAVKFIRAYFQMEYSLTECYREWADGGVTGDGSGNGGFEGGANDRISSSSSSSRVSSGCPRMKLITAHLVGARVCRQDPWECLISFICSSNNNIKRITLILERFRRLFGVYICTLLMDDDGDSVCNGNHSNNHGIDEGGGAEVGKEKEDELTPKAIMKTKESMRKKVRIGGGTGTPGTFDGVIMVTTNKQEQEQEQRVLELYSFPSIDDLLAQDTLVTDSTPNPNPICATSAGPKNFSTKYLQEHVGLGYRSKFIYETVHRLAALGGNTKPLASVGVTQWFEELRRAPIEKWSAIARATGGLDAAPQRLRVQTQLSLLPGVGRKVADCVALFCLDHQDIVPVDVHVYNIAVRDYMRTGNGSGVGSDRSMAASTVPVILSLDDKLYTRIGDVFRAKFGPRAGFAHSVLFAAELPQFEPLLPTDAVADMHAFKAARAAETKVLKRAKAEIQIRKKQKLD